MTGDNGDPRSPARARARVEGNLLGENPIFALWRGAAPRRDEGAGKSARGSARASWSWTQSLPDGDSVLRRIDVKSPDGLLDALDMDVLVALLAIREANRDRDRVYFTRREIGQILGWSAGRGGWGGKSDRLVCQSLERLHGASIWFTNSWRAKREWTTVREGIHLLEGVKIFDRQLEGFARRGKTRGDFNWARLSEYIVRSIDEGHFAYLDVGTYRALPSGLARRLYLYLAWKRGRGGLFEIGLHRLAQHMPLTCANLTELRRTVERAADALATTPKSGPFLARPLELVRRGRSEFLLRFEVASRPARARPVPPAEAMARHVTRFYEMVGVEPTQERLAQDLRVLTRLKEQGFTDEDLKYAVSYMFSRPKEWKNPRSLGLLPHVMPHAIKDKRKREEEERQRQAQSIKRDAERLKAERDRLYADRARELARLKIAELSPERLADLRREAAELPIVKGMPRQLRDGELAYQVERLVLERCCTPEELAACEPQLARPD